VPAPDGASESDAPGAKELHVGNLDTCRTNRREPNLAELPDKIRVHALAKLLERSSREVLDALTDLGEDGRSAQSSINRDVALKVAETLLGLPDEPAELAEPEPAAPPARPLIPPMPVFASASPLFLPPEPAKAKSRRRARSSRSSRTSRTPRRRPMPTVKVTTTTAAAGVVAAVAAAAVAARAATTRTARTSAMTSRLRSPRRSRPAGRPGR